MKTLVLALVLSVSSLMATTVERDCSKLDAPMVESLQGIVILGSWDHVRNQPVTDCDCVIAEDVLLLERHPKFLQKLYDTYIGKALTQKAIWNLKNEITDFYRSQNQPFVVVSIPKQELTKCMLQVVVKEAVLGEVYSSGNCYFPTRWLAEEMSTNPGDPIDTKVVYEDIAWLNLNPFRRTDAIFKPGEKPGTTDIELVTIDRWPYRMYVGADNTGTIPTNRNRLFFGFNFGKSILKDGQISYQFTFAPNWNRFFSHTVSARLPLPWRNIFVLWGGYSEVEPDTGISNMKNHGKSWQVDVRYQVPLFLSSNVMQTVVLGYDFKETNNNLLFDGNDIFKANADINQFMVGYEFGYATKSLNVIWNTEVYASPGEITYADKNRLYDRFRAGAKNQYAYIKMVHQVGLTTNSGIFSCNLNGQLASANLLPSEQITMTGYNAVRGFEERVLNLDNGLIVNLTYETPHVSFAKWMGKCEHVDEFYLLAFFDCGFGRDHLIESEAQRMQSLGSIGPGARYQVGRYVSARFDYGIQLWNSGFHNPTNSRYNFGLTVSY